MCLEFSQGSARWTSKSDDTGESGQKWKDNDDDASDGVESESESKSDNTGESGHKWKDNDDDASEGVDDARIWDIKKGKDFNNLNSKNMRY